MSEPTSEQATFRGLKEMCRTRVALPDSCSHCSFEKSAYEACSDYAERLEKALYDWRDELAAGRNVYNGEVDATLVVSRLTALLGEGKEG